MCVCVGVHVFVCIRTYVYLNMLCTYHVHIICCHLSYTYVHTRWIAFLDLLFKACPISAQQLISVSKKTYPVLGTIQPSQTDPKSTAPSDDHRDHKGNTRSPTIDSPQEEEEDVLMLIDHALRSCSDRKGKCVCGHDKPSLLYVSMLFTYVYSTDRIVFLLEPPHKHTPVKSLTICRLHVILIIQYICFFTYILGIVCMCVLHVLRIFILHMCVHVLICSEYIHKYVRICIRMNVRTSLIPIAELSAQNGGKFMFA